MNEPLKLWSATGANVSFYGNPFELSKHRAESGALSDGENRQTRYQLALINILKGKQCDVPPNELVMAIIPKLLEAIKQDDRLNSLDEKNRNTLIEVAISQLPIETSLTFSMMKPPQNSAATKTQKTTNKPTQLAAFPLAATAKKPQPPKKETPKSVREFTLEGDNSNIEGIRIFFAGDEIYLDDPDEHIMLVTILEAQENSKRQGLHNDTLAVVLGSAKRVPALYMNLLRSMEAEASGSSKALSFDKTTKRHTTNVPVKSYTTKDENPKSVIALLGSNLE
ncbi:MAG: hypothetical protein GW778_02135 [Alphaproteobacteria bacterium]|nr:hypothetical protein [Alphaproteobacteria bacterium]